MVLFEFSRKGGVVGSSTGDSRPVTLSLVPEERTKVLKNTGMPLQGKTLSNALYYRVPDMARLELDYGTKNLISERIPVYQYGAVLRLPLVMDK